jgi:hypothetical protein
VKNTALCSQFEKVVNETLNKMCIPTYWYIFCEICERMENSILKLIKQPKIYVYETSVYDFIVIDYQ